MVLCRRAEDLSFLADLSVRSDPGAPARLVTLRHASSRFVTLRHLRQASSPSSPASRFVTFVIFVILRHLRHLRHPSSPSSSASASSPASSFVIFVTCVTFVTCVILRHLRHASSRFVTLRQLPEVVSFDTLRQLRQLRHRPHPSSPSSSSSPFVTLRHVRHPECAAAMTTPARTCDICGKVCPSRNLARHKRQHKRPEPHNAGQLPPTPVEQSEKISDVLQACGLDPAELGGWNMDMLNDLPNIRHSKPTSVPRRHHTPWRFILDQELNVLPSLEDFLVDIAYRARRNGNLPPGTEVWQENERINFTAAEWVQWSKAILEGVETVLTRVLNIPMTHMIAAEKSQAYRHHAAEVAARYTPNLGESHQNTATANVTPRGTRTEVHHDSEHHISTAFGLVSRKNRPLKLWLLWPSTELRHLAMCYSDTNAALLRMEHGSFFVQMPGESVFVPPNSPHAVISLESCYLYGHTFSSNWAYDPSTVLVERRSGEPDHKACPERVHRLRLGLRSDEFRQVYLDQFMETWAIEAPILRGRRDDFEDLVAVWADDIRDNGCAWCVASGMPELYNMEMDDMEMDTLEHARAHLEGRMPATVSG